MAEIVAVLTTVVTIAGLIAALIGHLSNVHEKIRSDTIIIGVPPNVDIPQECGKWPVFSSLNKAMRSRQGRAVVLMSSVSRALRSCDFVIVDNDCDVKLINIDSSEGLDRIRLITGG